MRKIKGRLPATGGSLFLLIAFFTFPLTNAFSGSAEDYCRSLGVDPYIVETIAELEGVKREGRFYPYVIRVNSKKYIIKGLPRIKGFSNSYDCLNKETCIMTVKKLVSYGIKNIDLGSFQLNYKYWEGNKEELLDIAFSVDKSYRKVCEIVSRNLKMYGYSANAVARYHSSKPIRNYLYAVRFWKIYTRKIEKRGSAVRKKRLRKPVNSVEDLIFVQ